MQKEFGQFESGRPPNGAFLTALGCSMVLHICLLLAFSVQSERAQSPGPERQSIPVTLVAGPEPPPQSEQTRRLPPAADKAKPQPVAEPAPPPPAKPAVAVARPEPPKAVPKAAVPEAATVAKPALKDLAKPAADKLAEQERSSRPPDTAMPDKRQNMMAAPPVAEATAIAKEGVKTEGTPAPPTQLSKAGIGSTAAEAAPGEHKMPTAKEQTIVRAEPPAAVRNAYQDMLRQRIERYKTYPPMARRGNQEGTARISFELDRQGRLTDCRLEQTSGYRLLDRAAMKAVQAGAPFPAFPEELLPQSAQASFAIPVTFVLGR